MKITVKMWTIIGAIAGILGLFFTLMMSGGNQETNNYGNQNTTGSNSVQIQGSGNNVIKK